MDAAQEEQLRQQKEMQRLEARVREAAARQALPGGGSVDGKKVEGEAERRMRELYEERLREYGDLATGEEAEDAAENRCVGLCCGCRCVCAVRVLCVRVLYARVLCVHACVFVRICVCVLGRSFRRGAAGFAVLSK